MRVGRGNSLRLVGRPGHTLRHRWQVDLERERHGLTKVIIVAFLAGLELWCRARRTSKCVGGQRHGLSFHYGRRCGEVVNQRKTKNRISSYF